MDFGSLLRGGRVVGAVLRLVGRYRLASFIGLGVVVGWFVLGLQGDAHAADGGLRSHPGRPGVLASFDRSDTYVGPVAHGGPVAYVVAFVACGVLLGLVAGWILRLNGVPVRHRAEHGAVRRDPGGAVLSDVGRCGSPCDCVGL